MTTTRSELFGNAKNPLILQTKFEEIQAYTHDALWQFPKKERFLLCAQIRETVEAAMHEIIRFRMKYYKKTSLQDLDIEIEYLRTLVREAHKQKYISTGKRMEWIAHLDEAGRIVGGLKKYYASKAADGKQGG
ncbi:MAG: diversity-generating retroelement protein Avd [Selenomonadaceae bacterium]|nr:diversity-generating retroelement protein Avd [Selenomonadaceae bacterium]MBP3722365.1 diversity-generating retroelement protein Avd [Selenomonadaceae bacterium]